MPRTRGNLTPGECPWRVKSSERFIPQALTRMRTRPAVGVVHDGCAHCFGHGGEEALKRGCCCLFLWDEKESSGSIEVVGG